MGRFTLVTTEWKHSSGVPVISPHSKSECTVFTWVGLCEVDAFAVLPQTKATSENVLNLQEGCAVLQ
jgi:hypothetical protein